DPDEVARLADHMLVMDSGGVSAAGEVTEMMTRLDQPLARTDSAAAILEGTVDAHEDTYHLSWVGTQGGRIAVPRLSIPVGNHVRLRIQARDVSIALSPHHDTSILNLLPVCIVDTLDINEASMIARLEMQGGQTLLARLTRRSAAALGLREGMGVYAQVKSVALVG
ncbi:MAG: TOBE domain-containing protein, partial [Gammaproteobacteria bacterium]